MNTRKRKSCLLNKSYSREVFIRRMRNTPEKSKHEWFKCRYAQCCQLSDFSDPLSDFFIKKRLATNLATFGKTLATFQMSPVLSCEREILSYTSPCVCSDQWPHGSWHRCEWAAHVHTVLPRTNHLPASPLFEIKLFVYWATSERLYVIVLTHTQQ